MTLIQVLKYTGSNWFKYALGFSTLMVCIAFLADPRMSIGWPSFIPETVLAYSPFMLAISIACLIVLWTYYFRAKSLYACEECAKEVNERIENNTGKKKSLVVNYGSLCTTHYNARYHSQGLTKHRKKTYRGST